MVVVQPQPPVTTAVQLDQHARSGHPLATDPVLGWTATARTAQTGVQQDPPQGGPADMDAFPFSQQLREMGVVDSFVLEIWPGTPILHKPLFS